MKSSRAGETEAGQPTATDRESGVVVARESRRYPRRVALLTARVSTLKADRDPKTQSSFYILTDARTLDIGDAGVGLEVDDAVAEGRRVMFEVDLPDGTTVTSRASVVWSAEDRDAHYLGLCFDEPLPGLIQRV